MRTHHKYTFTTALSTFALFALAACGSGTSTADSSYSASASAETTSASSSTQEIKEASTVASRIAITYDGGVMVYDARKLEQLADLKKDGFLRLNPSGDGRHMTVSDGNSYTVLDMGFWEQPHGDHSHYYSTSPTLTSLSFASDHTGHVIYDHGKTAMFSDGTGEFEVYNPADLTGENSLTASAVKTEKIKLPEAHHGLAIPLEDNQYFVSVGNEESRSGAAVIKADGTVVTESKECPGVHGEAMAEDGVITVGCEDGALIYKDGKFTKVTNPEDPYSRSGNQAGSADSPVVLADYKTDKDAELERPEQFSLINTETMQRNKVQLPEGVSYTFRSLARGPEGEALMLTTDGKLHFYNEETGEELGNVQIMDEWEESEVWQEPRPAIWVDGKTAYVTDPEAKKLHAVSLKNIEEGKAEVFASIDLPEVPNEINGVTGKAPEGVTVAEAHDHGSDEHESHDHSEEAKDH